MEKATSVHGQYVPGAGQRFRRFSYSRRCSHTRSISGMLADYVTEHFLLKIALETAFPSPALADKSKTPQTRLQASSWENAAGGEGRVGEGAWEG